MSVNDLYEKADEHLLSRLQEDSRIELKRATVHSKELSDYFVMWANTPPEGGLIVIGVENDGSISGCMRSAQTHLNNLERTGEEFNLNIRYDYKRVHVHRSDGAEDYVLLIRVHYRKHGKLARNSQGKAFIRLGETKKELNEDEIRELEIGRGYIEFEQELTDYQYPQDFNTDLIQQYISGFHKSRDGDLREDIRDIDILEIEHLGTIESDRFIPNVACVLAFANDPRKRFPGCKIRFLRFEGEVEGTGERWNPIKDISIDRGPIPLLILETERVIDSQIRTFTRLGSDNKFHTAPEYPKIAWYEAVVNACVHRSYNLKNMNIFIKMFDDRLEIESPGGFPPLVTPETIYKYQHPRNPFLMTAMLHLRFVRAAREGARRMRDSMLAMELRAPEFSERDEGHQLVRVILRNDYKQRKVLLDSDAMHIVGEAIYKTLSQEERRAINYATEHGSINVSDLMRLIQRSWHHSKRVLEHLKKREIFEDDRRDDIARDPQARYKLATRAKKFKSNS
jgi:ATP-dependent DNA helicase RecG